MSIFAIKDGKQVELTGEELAQEQARQAAWPMITPTLSNRYRDDVLAEMNRRLNQAIPPDSRARLLALRVSLNERGVASLSEDERAIYDQLTAAWSWDQAMHAAALTALSDPAHPDLGQIAWPPITFTLPPS